MSDKTREFAAWWESDGKYCRAGGGDYERTFARRLRDHLAGQALASQVCLALSSDQGWNNRQRAEWAYEQADAMLAARDAASS